MLEIKPFTPNDYQTMTDIENSVFTDDPYSAESNRRDDANRPAHIKHQRWAAWLEGQGVAYGHYTQDAGQYHPQRFRLWAVVRPEYQRQGIGSQLWEVLLESLQQHQPIGFVSSSREDMFGLEFLKARGFTEKMRTWENRIDVPNFDPRPYAYLRGELEQQGIEILNLEKILTRENAARDYYQLTLETSRDVPRAYPMTERSFEDFAKWNLDNPKALKAGTFLAVQNNELIGKSQLFKTDGEHLNIGLTAVRREARGKHIALALKVACLEWAKTNGYPEIRTWNDSNNAPILALNIKLGFVQCPAWIESVKELQGANP
jgi:mycothiol synthase